MPYSRINTDFRDMSNVPFNGEMIAILHQAITLPEGTKLQAQRYKYPVLNGVAYDDTGYTLKAEVPATATATPANVLVSIWLKDTRTTRLTYVGAYIIPEMVGGTPVSLASLTNQDPEAGVVLAVAAIGGLAGTVNLAGNVTVDAVSNTLIFNGLRYRGTWDMDTAYAQGDIVTYSLDLWVAARINTGQTPVESADWQLFLEQPEVPPVQAAGINWRGPWIAGTVYEKDDGVEFKGSAWIATVDHTSVAATPPATGSSQWSLVAAAGIGVSWHGPWTTTDTYKKGDGVTYLGRAYVANKEVSANQAPGTSGSALAAGNVATTGGAQLINVGSAVGFPASNAFDGDNATYWEADSDTGFYNAKGIGNVWGTMRTIEKVVIRQHPTDYHHKMPSLFFEITTDGITWEALSGGARTIPGNGFGTQELPLSTPVTCTGFRVKPGAGTTAGGTGYPWRVYTLEFHAQAVGGGSFWDLISDKGFIFKGAWSAATTYAADEVVTSGGETWLCKLGHTNVTPVEGATWTKLAAKGDPGTGSGTVTSVGLAMPAQFGVTGSPVTGTGTLTAAWNAQGAKTVLAGPASGAAAAPAFRQLGLGELSDVDLATAPTDGQVLKFDNASAKWKPQADATGGASVARHEFKAYRNTTDFAIAAGATAKVEFNAESYDVGGTYDAVTSFQFTAPAAGDYLVSAQLTAVRTAAGTNEFNVKVYVNGAEVAQNGKTAATNQEYASACAISVPLQLAASDTVTIYCGTVNAVNIKFGSAKSWLAVTRIK